MMTENCSHSATIQKKRSLRLVFLVARIILLSTPIWAMPFIKVARSSLMFVGDFESGFADWKKELCCSDSAQIVSSPTRAGQHAVKFTLRKSDPKKRAELRLNTVPANSEHWYGFSIFIPQAFEKDSSYDIIAQWAGFPDFDLGETWRRPVLVLNIQNDKLRLGNFWDPKSVTVSYKEAGSQGWDLGAVPKNTWTDWVFHVKWSYKSDGLIEVWKNGQLVVQKTGPNTYNDERGPFLKVGIYKPEWKANPRRSNTTERVIYHDEVREGDASADYSTVMPGSVVGKSN